jgi:hypothetical protein
MNEPKMSSLAEVEAQNLAAEQSERLDDTSEETIEQESVSEEIGDQTDTPIDSEETDEQIREVRQELDEVSPDVAEDPPEMPTENDVVRFKTQPPETKKFNFLSKALLGIAAFVGVAGAGNNVDAAARKKIPPQNEQAKIPEARNKERVINVNEIIRGVQDINSFCREDSEFVRNLGLDQFKIEFKEQDRTRIVKIDRVSDKDIRRTDYNMVKDRTIADITITFDSYQKDIQTVKNMNIPEDEKQNEILKLKKEQGEALARQIEAAIR